MDSDHQKPAMKESKRDVSNKDANKPKMQQILKDKIRILSIQARLQTKFETPASVKVTIGEMLGDKLEDSGVSKPEVADTAEDTMTKLPTSTRCIYSKQSVTTPDSRKTFMNNVWSTKYIRRASQTTSDTFYSAPRMAEKKDKLFWVPTVRTMAAALHPPQFEFDLKETMGWIYSDYCKIEQINVKSAIKVDAELYLNCVCLSIFYLMDLGSLGEEDALMAICFVALLLDGELTEAGIELIRIHFTEEVHSLETTAGWIEGAALWKNAAKPDTSNLIPEKVLTVADGRVVRQLETTHQRIFGDADVSDGGRGLVKGRIDEDGLPYTKQRRNALARRSHDIAEDEERKIQSALIRTKSPVRPIVLSGKTQQQLELEQGGAYPAGDPRNGQIRGEEPELQGQLAADPQPQLGGAVNEAGDDHDPPRDEPVKRVKRQYNRKAVVQKRVPAAAEEGGDHEDVDGAQDGPLPKKVRKRNAKVGDDHDGDQEPPPKVDTAEEQPGVDVVVVPKRGRGRPPKPKPIPVVAEDVAEPADDNAADEQLPVKQKGKGAKVPKKVIKK